MLTNQDMHNEISSAFTRFKKSKTNRQNRIEYVAKLTERYFLQHEKMPATHVLDRMATLILQDELADIDRMKMRNTEYPLLSETQELYRKKDERSLKAAQDVATDGVDYRIRTRDSNRRMREVFG
ncbi:hypothetical protein [Lysinibacillus capsici]|uniref:hypothetical protein n=1 Tax=Lysinibacillus capsici TaxID=2115968 RepID=UPI000E20304E|nr:hypothetical protein [Lysinibacillus capsici]RDV27764.1 hypothetical protein C7B89_19495 [Lysinibacillus capsici]